MSPLPTILSHSLRNSHIMLFTMTVVGLVVFLKRVAARATFAVSKSSLGAALCTFFRLLAFRFLDLKPGVGGVLDFFLRIARCVGVRSTLVASVGGGLDVVLAASTILAGSIVFSVAPPWIPSCRYLFRS